VAGHFGPDGKHWGFLFVNYFQAKTLLAVSKTRFVKQSEKILQNSWGNIWLVLCSTIIFGVSITN